MIIFRSISYKNFLSTGNVPNVVRLDSHNTSLITGKNGEGKSTILCALTFGLFGKPFRNINKPQLINSINQKNLMVEIEFEVSGKVYIVKRGIKPVVFQIICDGILLNEEADSRDYQKILEQQILKLNYKTFTQVVILGSATFVPFMQLPSQKRREIIEDILDIRVFSVMNILLKEKMSKLKDQIADVELNIATNKIKMESQKKLIVALQTSKDSVINSILIKIKENEDTISESQSFINNIEKENEELTLSKLKYSNVASAITQVEEMKIKFNTLLHSRQKDVDFFDKNDTCPRCSQNIDHEYKQNVLTYLQAKISDQEFKIDELSKVYTKLTNNLAKLNQIEDKINGYNKAITTQNHTITLLNRTNAQLMNELSSSKDDHNNILEESSKLTALNEEFVTYTTDKTSLLETRQLYDVAFTLLKDTGIKTAIIHEYLPVINKLINMYLGSMDFYSKFELDETFQETIRSRNRDIFSYNSFSEGEKQKINLAILLTWRQIAKMKNSVNTNLLIMDEIFDSSLDTDSVDLLSSILKELTKNSNTNIFIISHRDISGFDMFDRTIRYEKRNEFSIIT